MARKTFHIARAKEIANRMLARPLGQEEKAGICTFIETLLMEADAYQGFNHRRWLATGCQAWHDAGEPDFPEKWVFIVGDGEDAALDGEYSRTYH